MAHACIDIGSNTTRLLVAEAVDGQLRELLQQRAFTRIGKGRKREDRIDAAKIAEVAQVVATQVRLAEELGALELRAVATAAIRQAGNGDELAAAIRDEAGVDVHILDGEEEARLAFVGATRTLGHRPDGEVGVVDVGGGSSELVLGTLTGGVRWSASFRIGSGYLADAYLRSDPPSIGELNSVRHHVAGVFEGLEVDSPALDAVAPCSSGSCSSSSAELSVSFVLPVLFLPAFFRGRRSGTVVRFRRFLPSSERSRSLVRSISSRRHLRR